MKVVIPQNIYAAIFAMNLPDEIKGDIKVTASSLIANEVEKENSDIGLMPSFDLLNHKELYISKKAALSFDGLLSNTYFYFVPGKEKIYELFLRGDVSSNEIILSKILFSERFDSNIKLTLDTSEIIDENKNYIITGNDNFGSFDFNKGISFADQIAELIDFPYVNYVWASKDEEKRVPNYRDLTPQEEWNLLIANQLKEFNNYFNELDKSVEDRIEIILQSMNFRKEVNEFIEENLNSVYFEITENEIAGLYELLKLPYFHGITKEMFELKLV